MTSKEPSEYDAKAEAFLKKTGTTFNAVFLKHDKHFKDDKVPRDIYEVSLTRGSRVFKCNFGQSIAHSGRFICWDVAGGRKVNDHKEAKCIGYQLERNKAFEEVTAYCVLASMQKYDPGSFKDFCANFDYDDDSIAAREVYEAVSKEFSDLQKLFSDEELEEMQEIQ
jgi:hypothetical protein